MLRPYQRRMVDASIDWMRRSARPFIVEAATGAGKSHIIAEVARDIHERSKKRVLCLAPSAELVMQNRAKYLAAGYKASVFSASAGAKELRHPVVFGTPLTVKNHLAAFTRGGPDGYAMVVLDEAHGITPTIREIIEAMREASPNLRVMGLTATPYRLGSGYIYRMRPDGRCYDESQAREPYFDVCVESVDARELIDGGYLTPPVIGAINAAGYETSGLEVNARGQFEADAIDRAYHGHGRKTAAIVADVVAQAQNRRGVMFFAATVRHAGEVLASLPPELSDIVTADTPRKEREKILSNFKAQRIKYIVNVSVLTIGFDAPHVDVIAILRKTESVGLLQQIIGRGLRLCEGKHDCLVLDYTTNLEDHCPDGDLFAPRVMARKKSEGGGLVAICPECQHENDFTIRKEVAEAGYQIDAAGYCLDLMGMRIDTDWGPMPAHYGRRCLGYLMTKGGPERCGYRWTSKDCETCGAKNDLAARFCVSCKTELVDPNERLAGEFRALKRDPTRRQTDRVVLMTTREGVSRSGNRTIRADYVTPYRSFPIWYMPEPPNWSAEKAYNEWFAATAGGTEPPQTITYIKEGEFFRALGYNLPEDQDPTEKTEKQGALTYEA